MLRKTRRPLAFTDNEIVQSVSVDSVDVADDADTRKGLSVVERMQIFLKDQTEPTGEYIPIKINEIAEAIDATIGSVRTRLSENVDKEGFWEKAATGEYKYKDKEPEW